MAKPADVDGLAKTAMKHPDKACVIESPSGRVFTWREHIEQRNRLASALARRGIEGGDRVVCYGNNSHGWVLARSTATIMNCYFVPMNWHLAAPEVAYVVDNCTTGGGCGSVVMVDGSFVPTLKEAREQDPAMFARVRHYIVWDGDGRGDGIGEPLDAVLAGGDPAFPRPERLLARSMAYTGGTSGKPKAVVRHGGGPKPTAKQMMATAMMMGPKGLNLHHPDLVHIVAAPMYHAAPGAFMAMAAAGGATMVVMRKFDARQFLALVAKHGVKTCMLPPILVKRISDLPEAEIRQHDISSLRSVVSAGAPCPMPVKEAALRMGMPLYEFYGSSELGLNTVLQPADMLRKPGSCGRMAGAAMKIIDDAGNECPRGTPGLLYIQTPVEYYSAEKKSRDAQLKSDPSFVTVGDVAYVDDEGFVFICDRKIDMILSGGVNIYPAEIEDCLFRHPDVADVAVFGAPDAEYGERVHAAVLLKPGRAASAADIQAFARRHIAGFKVPREVSFHPDFPRTPAGKVLKRQLRDKHWKGAAKL